MDVGTWGKVNLEFFGFSWWQNICSNKCNSSELLRYIYTLITSFVKSTKGGWTFVDNDSNLLFAAALGRRIAGWMHKIVIC